MANKKDTKEKISVDRLVIGLFIDLELSWSQHPFFLSKFKIKSNNDISAIKQLGLTEVTIFPEYSDVQLGDLSGSSAPQVTENKIDELWEKKNQQVKQARLYRDQRKKLVAQYNQQALKVRTIANDLKSKPANAIHDAEEIVEGLASLFDDQEDLFTNLINLGTGEHTFYNHSINVTILSLILGSAEGVKGDSLRQLAMGALLHDVGKIKVPNQILVKQTKLTRPEKELLQLHTTMGRKLTERVKTLPPMALDIIDQHHEMLDGSGYPHKLSADRISQLVRIVTVANVYDNLCNPHNPANALTPKAALATMYTRYQNKLDKALVARLIQTIGVYPPGTVVRLNDESIGLVIAVDPNERLKPELLLYNPDIPYSQALIVDLKEHDGLTVQDVLRPGEYPSRIYEYLRIDERIGYYVDKRK